MITPDGIRPRLGDERGFIHKKILGGISAVAGVLPIPGAQIVSGITGRLARPSTPRPTLPRSQTARVTRFSQVEKLRGQQTKFPLATARSLIPGRIGITLPCIWPTHRDPETGDCILGERKGRDLPGDRPIGEAVMGQYGAGLVPGSMPVDRAVCLRGMQLGNDGVCYNKGQISNKQRMWPAGRKPLLTGGDMRAISIASRAGKRMDVATARLQKMGMMKKPASRTGATKAEIEKIRHAALLEAHAGSKH